MSIAIAMANDMAAAVSIGMSGHRYRQCRLFDYGHRRFRKPERKEGITHEVKAENYRAGGFMVVVERHVETALWGKRRMCTIIYVRRLRH